MKKPKFAGFFQFIQTGIERGFVSSDILDQCVISENSSELLRK